MRSFKMLMAVGLVALVMDSPARPVEDKQAKTETHVVTREIPFETQYILTRDLGPGRLVRWKVGEKGVERKIYEVVPNGPNRTHKRLIRTEVELAKPEVYRVGRAGFSTDRGSWNGRQIRTMESTAYHPSDGLSRPPYLTKMGVPAKFGVVAVDPRVIPLGSYLFVEGYGFAYACDIGGAIKGNKIDVCIENLAKVRQWGRRKVRVHILSRK
jgi:3D (Asp-Asp-Asp) domain-containing protein